MSSKNEKKIKMNYRFRRRTLKGKLHRSLSLTSFLSVMISLFSVLIILALIVGPMGHFLTDSINNKINRNYMQSHNFEMDKENNVLKLLETNSFEEIIELSENKFTAFDDAKLEKVKNNLLELEINEIEVYGDVVLNEKISEEEKKTILASTYYALQDIDHFLSLGETMGMNWVNVRLSIDDVEIFKIPRDYDMDNATYTQKKFDEIQSTTYIVDRDNNIIGELVTSLNPSVLFIILMPVMILFGIIAIMTLIVVRVLILPLQYNILKPINVLNKELKNIAEYDLIECNTIAIEQKKPPTEIKELIDNSNKIINKLRSSNYLLETQKEELESQNIELDLQKESLEEQNIELDVQKESLEEQNIELDAQKESLEEQNIELDAQKEELSAQNNELMESQEKLRNAQSQLVQSEKMASMGQLTAAIMHEINTPLGAVKSNNQMSQMMLNKLKNELEDNENALKTIKKLLKSSDITDDATTRVSEIIRNLKNFSRIDQASFQNSDIIEGLKSVLVLTSNLWKNKVSIHELYDELPLVSCYPSMLNQVFMNIIVNAVHASDKNGDIYIKTKHDDENVFIIIEDNGSGIKESDINHVFDSGFTTKPQNEGTGLGLSISKDIIDKHNGKIEVFNNDLKGSTFRITLPIGQLSENK